MRRTNPSVMTHRGLLLFKWLMVLIPPLTVTVAVWHYLPRHPVGRGADALAVAAVALAVAYVFAESMFKVLRRLQAEAIVREEDILTLNAVTRERERLSRELHDGSAQLVAHLLLRLDTITELVAAGRPVEARSELERLHGVADEIYRDIGESIAGIRADMTERGLIRTLRDYVDQFEERHDIPVQLNADDAADRFSPLDAFQIFRLVQEALTNVRKHAGAREATVTLSSDASGRLTVVIGDDGRGFTPGARGNGTAAPLGLTGMRERVDALGGVLHVASEPGSGTRVTATIPIPRVWREHGHAAVASTPG